MKKRLNDAIYLAILWLLQILPPTLALHSVWKHLWRNTDATSRGTITIHERPAITVNRYSHSGELRDIMIGSLARTVHFVVFVLSSRENDARS